MKTEEDEAFDDLARKQGAWGGGFPAKRAMAADKLQEPVRGALKLALEALESSRVFVTTREKIKHPEGTKWYDERITAIKAALAQPAQEPLAHVYLFDDDGRPLIAWNNAKGIKIGDKLYTTPLQREWVGLTDEDIHNTVGYDENREMYQFALALIAKLKAKNS